MSEVGVLDRPDADGLGDGLFLLLAQSAFGGRPAFGDLVGVLLRHKVIGPLDGLVEQVHELDRSAGAGLERLAVRAHHRAKGDVLQRNLFRREPCRPRGREDHLKMQALPRVHDIQHAIGMKRTNAVSNRRQVRRGVEIRIIRLLNDQRQWRAILGLELRQEHARRALGFRQQPGLPKAGNNFRQVFVIITLTSHILSVQFDSQSPIDTLAMAQRNLTMDSPRHDSHLIAGLELNNSLAGPLGKICIRIKT